MWKGLVGAVLATAAAAFAQSGDNVPATELRSLLTELKIPFEEGSGTTVKLKMDGRDAVLTIARRDLLISLQRAGQPPLDRINQWNATHRFTRAYLDSAGVHLDADLETASGVSRAAVKAFIANFARAAELFSDEFAKLTAGQPAARSKIGLPYGNFALWINPQEWAQSENRGGNILFRQTHGDGYAMVITEPGMVPDGLTGLKKVIETNAKKNTPDMQITALEPRKVNGREVLVLSMEGTVSGMPLRYLTNSYSGPSGTIQVLTYTGKDLFEKSRPLFTELLEGLEINETAGPTAGKLTLNSGKATVDYDPAKWKVVSSRVEQYVLAHESGELYAQVIAEGIEMPPDKIVEIALANLKREATEAAATSREQVTINGYPLARVEMEATVRGLALSYQN
jgi:hypothetical protein